MVKDLNITKKEAKEKYKNSKYEKEGKQLFNVLRDRENGNFSFDSGIITGCKQYALKKNITILGKKCNIEIAKCKGYSKSDKKLSFNDMEKLNNGDKIKQKQSQFRCPKSNYVSETNSFKIKTQYVTKSFRKYYTKGIEDDDGNITPLII